MIPRKKRILIFTLIIAIPLIIIFLILGILYLKTDMFKSKQTLFAKYILQNFNALNIVENNPRVDVNKIKENNKYSSDIQIEAQYKENVGTSDENTNNPINDVNFKMNIDSDENNGYCFQNIKLNSVNQNETLFGVELLKQNENYGMRLNGINQFVSTTQESEKNELVKNIENIEGTLNEMNISSLISFSNEEKQKEIDAYSKILEQNISKDKFYKQKNAVITVENKNLNANAYYIKMNVEEYNNIYVKILEQLAQDEIILSKIDNIEAQIMEFNSQYNPDKTLREKVVEKINEKIEKLKSTNIGNDSVKITVYEQKGKTVRTIIEKQEEKIMLDLLNDNTVKYDYAKLGTDTEEKILKISNENGSIEIDYKNIFNTEVLKNFEFRYDVTKEDTSIKQVLNVNMANEKYEGTISITEDTKIVDEFESEITLERNNVNLDELTEEQKEKINNILDNNIQSQYDNVLNKITLNDLIKIVGNLGAIKYSDIELPEEAQITDADRTRFNSQFEFYASTDLTYDNVKELLKITQNNMTTMKILLKTGEIEELDLEKLKAKNQEATNYNKNISEILIGIQEGKQNEEKQKETEELLEKKKNEKYTVSLQYNENRLVDLIRIKIQ